MPMQNGTSQLQYAPPQQGQATGYSALDKATTMLNEMGVEAQNKLMLEEIRCGNYDRTQFVAMTVERQAVISANARAANARGRVIDNQGISALRRPGFSP